MGKTPLLRSSKTHGGELNVPPSNNEINNQEQITASTSIYHPHPEGGGDYFAGVLPGSRELHTEKNDIDYAKISFLQAPVRRRKPLSAAARLSSVYGALPQVNTPNASSPSPAPPSNQ